jgi:hypothetical protein
MSEEVFVGHAGGKIRDREVALLPVEGSGHKLNASFTDQIL